VDDAERVLISGRTRAPSAGPAPTFAGATLKPDPAAPGTDILSTNTAQDGALSGYTTSGTGMPARTSPVPPRCCARPGQADAGRGNFPLVRTDAAPATVQGPPTEPERAVDPSCSSCRLAEPGAAIRRRCFFTLNLRDVRLAGAGTAAWQPRRAGPQHGRCADLPATSSVPPELLRTALAGMALATGHRVPGVHGNPVVTSYRG
jgi:hypothetical protein